MKVHLVLPQEDRPWFEIVQLVNEAGYKIEWLVPEFDWGIAFPSEEEAALFKLTYL
jgi:hypothetical protein